MVSARPCVSFLPPAHPHCSGSGPHLSTRLKQEGEKGREREGESEEKVNRVEFLKIKAAKWGSCHTRLIF